MLLDKIEELLKEVSALTAKSADDVEQLRLKYLSKKGEINALMGEFRNVAADQKKVVGMKINELKQSAQDKINELKDQLETSEAQSDDIDLTRTAYPIGLGTRHPLTLVKNEIIDIFARMGFTLYQGPEIDDDEHVFTMLTSLLIIRLVICRTLSSLSVATRWTLRRMCFFVVTHRTMRLIICLLTNLQYVCFALDVSIVTRLSRLVHTASSIRLRAYMSIRTLVSPTLSRCS